MIPIKRLATRLLIPLLALFIPGLALADSPDAVATDAMAQMDKLVDALLTIKDKASAEKAMEDIKPVGEELKKIGARVKELGTVSPEVKSQIMAKIQAKALDMQKRLGEAKEQFSQAGLDAAAPLAKGMMDIGKAMQEFKQALENVGK